MMSFIPLTEREQAQLKDNLGDLPITGPAWPRWVKLVALLVLSLVVMQAGLTVQKAGLASLSNTGGLFLLIVFIGLSFITYFMQHSVTTIDENGIRQSWFTKRQVGFHEMSFAMVASKPGYEVSMHAVSRSSVVPLADNPAIANAMAIR